MRAQATNSVWCPQVSNRIFAVVKVSQNRMVGLVLDERLSAAEQLLLNGIRPLHL